MNMHPIAKLVILSFLISASSLAADQNKDIGVGVILGEPAGLSFNTFIAPGRSVDAGIGWSFSENDSLHLHADYLFHRFDQLTEAQLEGRYPLYYGLGLRVKFKSDSDDPNAENVDDELIGIRIPIGLSYYLDDQPIEFFAEVVPIIDLSPDVEFNVGASFGARYYF